jgi:thioredoxin reductase
MNNMKVKYLIVGAGPAGLQMGYFFKKAGLDYLIVEKNNIAGSFYKKFPIHRSLISINKKYNFFTEETFNLRHDWNSLLSDNESLKFTNYSDDLFPSADILYKYLNDFAKEIGLNIQYNTSIKNIKKNKEGEFEVEIENGSAYLCKVLLIGTGVVSQYMPNIEGIEHTIPYKEIPVDKKVFVNKRVAVLGGGNSAFETANHIADVAAHVHVLLRSPLKMAYETHFVGHLRAKYTNIFDMYQLKSLHAVLKPKINKITKLENGNLLTNHEYDFPDSEQSGVLKLSREYDYILNCTGFIYTHESLFADDIKPKTIMNNKFYDLNEFWESSNIENLHFIGTTMQAIDRKASSGFIHGFRYNIRTLSNMLLEKHENQTYPNEIISLMPFKELLEQLYKRFSIADAIFQLYGFLGDMLVFEEDSKTFKWYKDLPVKHINNRMPKDKKVLQLTLEFGFHHYPNKSSLEFLGPSDPNNTPKSAFLHPVIRFFYKEETKEFHFGDSLLGRWDLPHADGGAVASYHSEFYNWMADFFGLEKLNTASNESILRFETN